MYYLNTRYYDPSVGRFINADGQLNNSLLGYNLYAYCENNPVNRKDISGQFWITALIVTAVVAVCAVGLTGCSNEPETSESITNELHTNDSYTEKTSDVSMYTYKSEEVDYILFEVYNTTTIQKEDNTMFYTYTNIISDGSMEEGIGYDICGIIGAELYATSDIGWGCTRKIGNASFGSSISLDGYTFYFGKAEGKVTNTTSIHLNWKQIIVLLSTVSLPQTGLVPA